MFGVDFAFGDGDEDFSGFAEAVGFAVDPDLCVFDQRAIAFAVFRVVVAEEIGMGSGFHPCAMHQGLRGVGGTHDQVGAGTAAFNVVDRSDFQFGSVLSEFLRELFGFFRSVLWTAC